MLTRDFKAGPKYITADSNDPNKHWESLKEGIPLDFRDYSVCSQFRKRLAYKNGLLQKAAQNLPVHQSITTLAWIIPLAFSVVLDPCYAPGYRNFDVCFFVLSRLRVLLFGEIKRYKSPIRIRMFPFSVRKYAKLGMCFCFWLL